MAAVARGAAAGNAPDVDDAVQTVMLRALVSGRLNPWNSLGYWFRAGRNAARSQHRKQGTLELTGREATTVAAPNGSAWRLLRRAVRAVGASDLRWVIWYTAEHPPHGSKGLVDNKTRVKAHRIRAKLKEVFNGHH